MSEGALFSPERHYQPPKVHWDKATSHKTIRTIASEITTLAESSEHWPMHQCDGDGHVNSDFYLGKGGSLWAVDYLIRRGAIKSKFDVNDYLDALIADTRKQRQQTPHPENASYLFGELPLLLMQYRHTKSDHVASQIEQAIKQNDTQPVRELMWGLAGSMLAALFMYKWSEEHRWAKVYRNQANKMLAAWEKVDGAGYLWNIDLYGSNAYFLGAIHGFSGNAFSLIAGLDLLTDAQASLITQRIMQTVVDTAHQTEQHANWWPRLDSIRSEKNAHALLHFCHGAPGVVTLVAGLPAGVNAEFDEVLIKGGELIWDAGLLEKGPNLCHGTSGNGYAFLKLYERTGDELWLKRARNYAMQAIGQIDELEKMFPGPRRTPLWTGDAGTAVYLWDCIEATSAFPSLDVF